MPFYRTVLSCIFMLSLTACQFHLRGHLHDLGAQFPRMSISSDLVNSPMSHTLLHTLKAAGVSIVDEGPANLHLFEYRESSTPLAYGIEGEVRRERFEGRMTVEIKREDGELLLSKSTFTAIRDQLRYTDYDLATTSEKEHLLADLRQDLASQLVLKMSLSTLILPGVDEAAEDEEALDNNERITD